MLVLVPVFEEQPSVDDENGYEDEKLQELALSSSMITLRSLNGSQRGARNRRPEYWTIRPFGGTEVYIVLLMCQGDSASVAAAFVEPSGHFHSTDSVRRSQRTLAAALTSEVAGKRSC